MQVSRGSIFYITFSMYNGQNIFVCGDLIPRQIPRRGRCSYFSFLLLLIAESVVLYCTLENVPTAAYQSSCHTSFSTELANIVLSVSSRFRGSPTRFVI